jgi:hypothetical protein
MKTTRSTLAASVLCSFLGLVAWLPVGAADPAPFRVGAAAVELEADDSMVIGGGIGPGGTEGQEGKLRVVATVVEGPSAAAVESQAGAGAPRAPGRPTRVVLAACDVLMIQRDYLDPAARAIEAELGIPFENVLLSSTHTHHAPSTITIHGYRRDETFCARVRDGIVEATRRAVRRLEEGEGPAEMLFRLGEESSVGQNSRILLSDGTIFWVGARDDEVRPTGPFDPELPVIAFRRGGALESLIFNHSTHAIGTHAPGKRSPSFYGLVAQELELSLGGRVTFVPGAFGSTHNLRLGADEMALRIREAVLGTLGKARPMPVRVVRAIKRELPYRVRSFDEEREDAAVRSYVQKRLGGPCEYEIGVFRKMRQALAPHQGQTRKTWLQAVRIGDVAWVAAPGELFTSLGVEIKRRSPFRYTYIAGVANDAIGYIPDAKAFELGGYQLWMGLHSLVEKGTGEALVEAAVAILEELNGA